MPRITLTLIKSLAPTDAEYFVWDSEVKGFGVRVKPSGAMAFVLKYRRGRSTKRYTISKVGSPYTVDQARKVATDLLRAVKEGRDPVEAKAAERAALTVGELIDAYLTEGPAWKPDKRPRSWETNLSVLGRHVRPLLGRKVARDLAKADVVQMQSSIAAGATAATDKTKPRGVARVRGGRRVASVAVETVAAMYEFAIATGRANHNPAKGVQRFESPKRERFLSEAEVALLADALTELEAEELGRVGNVLADAIRLLMLTGCRKMEIATLEWSFVDFERKCLKLPTSKTGAKTVSLASAALAILARQPQRDADEEDAAPTKTPTRHFVFPAARGKGHTVGLQKAWSMTRKRATEISMRRAADAGQPVSAAPNLLNVRLHDLRHSFASFAIADGATLFMVGKVLGHKQARTTEIYAHLADDPIRQVTERTASKIAAAMEPKAATETANVLPLRR